ncbi:Multi antimicrobial extrusion protein [Corchorus olitorius]|uniref:Multi antimicrobial extrusion protein n=1 Tax=Corchorus olitorius TaxID=93759 RepID=A0A1R3KC73_9ROSI|nr:Multi antimicrobial extrusion protein [Corchorus olitorius]
MEESSLDGRAEEEKWKIRWSGFGEELKKVSYMAVPMVAVLVSQYLLRVASMVIVGHLAYKEYFQASPEEVGGSALEPMRIWGHITFGGGDEENKWKIKWSAFGEELKKMSYMAVPMVAVTVSQYLSQVISVMIVGHIDELALSGIALASSFTNVTGFSLICQSLILPMFFSSCAALCLHIPLCWALVYKTNLGITGAALSVGLASWFNVALLAFYMRYSSSCEKSRAFVFNDVFLSVKEFFSFGLPSAVMVCTRVSNELGAGNPQAARFAVGVAMVLAAIEPLIVSITLFCCRYIYGYLFSNEAEVVNYVAEMLPLLCISVIMDSLQAVLSGQFPLP